MVTADWLAARVSAWLGQHDLADQAKNTLYDGMSVV
jgi:hypothetical protein